MAKLLILLACLVGLAAAGVIDNGWRQGGNDYRFNNGLNDWDKNNKDVQKITRMTGDELIRQKVLLKLLDHVHDRLNDMDQRNVRDEFNTNQGNYKKGMDYDMLYVIQLQRSGRLLGKRDIFTIRKDEHKRQMIGLKRLLTRATDFETFVQNAVTARNHMNGVLFVNAMLLAVRERQDTRYLVVPGIHDILPELYIDRDTLSTLGNIDINLLTTDSGFDTRKPNLMDFIGLNNGNDRRGNNGNARWGQLGNLVNRNRNIYDVDEKIVIDEVNKNEKDNSMKLLTDDVSFKGFWHNLINDLVHKENEIEKEKNFGYGNNVNGGGQHRFTDINGNGQGYFDRNQGNWNMRNRFYDVIYTNGGRYTQNNNNDLNLDNLNVHCKQCIERKDINDCNKCWINTDIDVLDRLGKHCKTCIRNTNDYDCENCKNKIFYGNNQFGHQDNYDDYGFKKNRIFDGRKTFYTNGDDMTTDYMNNDINGLNTNCIQCIKHKNTDDCNKCKRTTDDNVIDQLDKDCKKCIFDVNYYDCDKCRNKLNLNTGTGYGYGKRYMDAMFGHKIADGRRNKYTNSFDDFNMKHYGNNKFGNNNGFNLNKINRNQYGDDFDMLGMNRFNTYDDGRYSNNNDWTGDRKKSTNSEVLLHNLKQVLARINLERISLGLDNKYDIKNDNVDDSNNGQGRNLDFDDYKNNDLNNFGLSERDVEQFVDIINEKLAHKTQNGQLDDRMNDFQVDRVIARTLLDRDGDVNLLDILTDVMVKNTGDFNDMQIERDLGQSLKDPQVIKVLRKIIRTVDNARTQILGTYKRQDLEFDDVKINDIVVDDLVTRRTHKDIDLTNLMDDMNNGNNKFVVVRQQQLTHDNFNIQIDVDSKRNQRVVVRTLIGPKRVDNMGRDMTLNERRSGFMLLDTTVVDLDNGRNVIQRNSRDFHWTKRGTTTLNKIYKQVMLGERYEGKKFNDVNDDDITGGHDCRFPHHLILPRGRFDGLDLELLVVITRYEGNYGIVSNDMRKKCTMGMSVKGVDSKSLGFPLDRHIDDGHDIRGLNNVAGVDIKIFDDKRKGDFNWQ